MRSLDRLEAPELRCRSVTYWPARVTGFLLGVGVGAGLGILLAPAAGVETREAIRDKAAALKRQGSRVRLKHDRQG